MSKPAIRTPVSFWEKEISSLLVKCTFLPASFAKRFVGNVHDEINTNPLGISDNQRKWLVLIFAKYRKQIPNFEKVSKIIPVEYQETLNDYLGNLKVKK